MQYVTATGGAMVRIPMVEAFVRSINLSASVGIGLYEAIRQRDESEGRISDAYELTDALGGAIPTLAHGSKKEAE